MTIYFDLLIILVANFFGPQLYNYDMTTNR